MKTQPIIIGSGLAGLTVALTLAPIPVTVLVRKTPGEWTSSSWAQGGIAAAVGEGDAPEKHAADTIAAGAGLCSPAIVHFVTKAAPEAIKQLSTWGVVFDHDEHGNLKLGLEGAHSHRRIVHALGDSTGATIIKALVSKARSTPSISLIEGAEATAITANESGVTGIRFLRDGRLYQLATDCIVLATGGTGALWAHTTNPLGSWGHGLALAARAGAQLRDLEFVQFHPTAIDVGADPMPLASEALRGESAVLVNDLGEKFMASAPRAELEPRDIVTRAIWAQLRKERHVFLDARMIPNFADHFPTIYGYCAAAGIDPSKEPIPIRPAAHYHMGGVAVDSAGRSTVSGLWVCGESAATNLHGANRLASNSLLEAVVFGKQIAHQISNERRAATGSVAIQTILNPSPSLISNPSGDAEERQLIRSIMSAHVSVLRNKEGLEKAINQLMPLAMHNDMALVGLMIATAALRRKESRGAHRRTDYPDTNPLWQRHETLTLNDIRNALDGCIEMPKSA